MYAARSPARPTPALIWHTQALTMFFATTVGVVAGGPLAVWLMGHIHKDAIAGDGVWRGLG